jgi:hypothetical protein
MKRTIIATTIAVLAVAIPTAASAAPGQGHQARLWRELR